MGVGGKRERGGGEKERDTERNFAEVAALSSAAPPESQAGPGHKEI